MEYSLIATHKKKGKANAILRASVNTGSGFSIYTSLTNTAFAEKQIAERTI
jgi:hypothetical protein